MRVVQMQQPKGLLMRYNSTSLLLLHIYLPVLSRLSKIFQTDCLDFSIIKPVVSSTVDTLSNFCENEGEFVKNIRPV